uniref:Calcineurin-like phosphoesterase domain-containing protein n=1 Tax=Chromera velia CCMP2878 TaxID=1169474 RepID=A0A0G4HTQ3_9ALVE|eukprot:Cvel_8511.t1-p1 / transcript=Cvel_8511.t1 / gene=Cvel_8511 / organism=Chromera_velia_CCMP2878 / gene_product=Probable inactive purple acid phosphatase 28, putative / transcript_product=Probable inactive purple acid phosphatase 28, putative / location=Cvel_scaffold471:32476-33906(-) / protein_length=477 / sequence_SO=supercontig / SO=protein_coding / is_pseudo=false
MVSTLRGQIGVRRVVDDPVVACESAQKEGTKTEHDAACVLHFRPDGSFKILIVGSLLLDPLEISAGGDGGAHCSGSCGDTLRFLDHLVKEESPDLVVFSGDQLVKTPLNDLNRFASDAYSRSKAVHRAVAAITETPSRLGVPFAVSFGGSDTQSLVSRAEQLRLYGARPGACVSPFDFQGERGGIGNFRIDIVRSPRVSSHASILMPLFFLDTAQNNLTPLDPPEGFGLSRTGGTVTARAEPVIEPEKGVPSPRQLSWLVRNAGEVLRNAHKIGTRVRRGMVFTYTPPPEVGASTPVSASPSGSSLSGGGGLSQTGVNLGRERARDAASSIVNAGFLSAVFESSVIRTVVFTAGAALDFCGRFLTLSLCTSGDAGFNGFEPKQEGKETDVVGMQAGPSVSSARVIRVGQFGRGASTWVRSLDFDSSNFAERNSKESSISVSEVRKGAVSWLWGPPPSCQWLYFFALPGVWLTDLFLT